ncbi:MAG: hypothetical protein LDLANPLL_02320 [Turneriella sp.]|nr:hypothetical protein [Turneriella sp.]
MEEKRSLKGKLLIANSNLLDGHFIQSVILIVEHDSRGSLGLILNNPLPSDKRRKNPLFKGGPVDPDNRALLHGAAFFASQRQVLENVFFESSDELLETLAEEGQPYRRYAGYAGWATGQLEYEIHTKSWILLDARADLIFYDISTDLWRQCLVEKGGLFRHFAGTHRNILLN